MAKLCFLTCLLGLFALQAIAQDSINAAANSYKKEIKAKAKKTVQQYIASSPVHS